MILLVNNRSGFWLLANKRFLVHIKHIYHDTLPELSGRMARPFVLCNLKFDFVIGDPLTITFA